MIEYPDGSNNLYGHIACGIGCGVGDVINTWCVGIHRTIGIGSTIALHNIIPLRSLGNVSGGCGMGDVGVPNQSDYWWCVILSLIVRITGTAGFPLLSV